MGALAGGRGAAAPRTPSRRRGLRSPIPATMPPTIISSPPASIPRWKDLGRGVGGGAVDLGRPRRRQAGGVGRCERLLLGLADRALRPAGESCVAGELAVDGRGELAGDHGAEDRDREQRRRPARPPLLIPEAIPTWCSSTELSAVAVSGATVAERPRPKTSIAGQDVGDVVRVRADPQSAAAARCRRRSVRRTSAPAGRSPSRSCRTAARGRRGSGDRRGRQPGLERRVAGGLLQEEGDEEEGRRSAPRRRSASRGW